MSKSITRRTALRLGPPSRLPLLFHSMLRPGSRRSPPSRATPTSSATRRAKTSSCTFRANSKSSTSWCLASARNRKSLPTRRVPRAGCSPSPTPRRTAAGGPSPRSYPDTRTGSRAITWSSSSPLASSQSALPSSSSVLKQPGKSAKILLQLSTNTYNAYTQLGRLQPLRLPRPAQGPGPARVVRPAARTRSSRNWELPFVAWAESERLRARLLRQLRPRVPPRDCSKHYKLVLSVGHDEYWSAPMRDNLESVHRRRRQRRVLQRQHLLLAGPQRGRRPGAGVLEAGVRRRPGTTRPATTSCSPRCGATTWSSRPENALTGVGFLWGGYHRSHGQFMDGNGAYTVHRPDHWLFAGTGPEARRPLRRRSCRVQDRRLRVRRLRTDLEGRPARTRRTATARPRTSRCWRPAPARWHPDDCEWYEKWEKGRTGNAVIGTYTRGGTVVTVGTTDWATACAATTRSSTRITKNVLDRLGKQA